MSHFQSWYDQADMPTQGEDGKWYDLEDGIAYDHKFIYGNRSDRKQLSDKALKNRQKAKFFGGKALRGTAKQKEWAEKIRAEKIQSMNAEASELICDLHGLCTHSKFWIKNRKKSAAEFESYIFTQKSLLANYKKAHENNNASEVSRIAESYNKLTAEWNDEK